METDVAGGLVGVGSDIEFNWWGYCLADYTVRFHVRATAQVPKRRDADGPIRGQEIETGKCSDCRADCQ